MPIISLLCGVFVDLGAHDAEIESLKTLHASPYQSVVMKRLCLGNLWFSGEGCSSSLMVLTLTTFFYLSQFIKVWKFSRNSLIRFTNDRISLTWGKNLVWFSHGSAYCFYRVSKISAIYPSCASSVVSLLIWELIILNQNHLKLFTHHRICVSWWENYVWATCDSVERGSWSSLMVLNLSSKFGSKFYLSQFIKVCKFWTNRFKLLTNNLISLGWGKNIVCISHGTPHCFYRISKIFVICPSWGCSVVSLFIWELIIVNQNHLKLCTGHRINLSCWKNYVWATCESVGRGF